MDVWLKQDKFHQVVLRRYRVTPIDPAKQTIRRLLCYYQELACASYPTEAKLTEVLGELYDAKFHVTLTTFGSYSLLTYSLTAVDPYYIEDSTYTINRLEEEFNRLIMAKMGNKTAIFSLFHRAYEIYESDLLSYEENISATAYQNMLSIYFKGTPRAFSSLGSLEELKKLRPKDVYTYYQEVLKEETISIGSGHQATLNPTQITLKPKQNYHFTMRGNPPSYVVEKSNSFQCYIHILYETGIYANDPLYYPCMFLNYILGGDSASYLFRIVREKYGLCYSIHSNYLGATGILVISCCLDPKLVKQGLEGIEEAIEELSKKEYDIEVPRSFYISNHKSGEDYMDTALQNYISDHYFLDSPKSDTEIEAFQKVTKEQVHQAYQSLKKSFVYILGGKVRGK